MEKNFSEDLKVLKDNPEQLANIMDTITAKDNQEESEENVEENTEETIEESNSDDDEVVPEEQPKKKTANIRIRELISTNKELKEELEYIKSQLPTKKVDEPKTYSTSTTDEINKQEILSKLGSKNPDDLLEGLSKISDVRAKKLIKEALQEYITPLALKDKAIEEGIDPKEINKIFTKYPELKDSKNGYEIAKSMITKKKSNISKETTTKSKPSTTSLTSENKNINKKELDKALINFFQGKG